MSRTLEIAVLGSTGSIGRAVLSLAAAFPDRLRVVALSAHRNVALLAGQIRRFGPAVVSVGSQALRGELLGLMGSPAGRPEVLVGPEGLADLAAQSGAGTVVSAVVGAAGLVPTWAALSRGLRVALANKESLVLAGDLLMALAGDRLSPVDSEHSAIFQALGGRLRDPGLRRLVLTASGGPFRGRSLEELSRVTAAQALAHPTWRMGPKISCDSATMMNKGLEVIEAHHLFGLGYDQIEVLVHPGSHVHSLAGFSDGSVLAQMGPADMRLAIAYALSHPGRWPLADLAGKDPDFEVFADGSIPPSLIFEAPDRKAFRALALAEAAGRAGGTAPAILNGANEVAVAAFLGGRLSFTGIAGLVEATLAAIPAGSLGSLADALAADAEARRVAEALAARCGF
ncbi:MAG: 1-deoxy-D-xylulose-5-phosphate reductoisomerase [Deltaproteobacteria bacterium]|jgi:1-deoxy-D-xylulose-5-phosphate reductoisomerase|nr:1-deoxy-D-xylulose-5-phosphate reductoisomerase [Deltaproteobacteria bacterium]